ncbi:Metal-independent alpha-mannosidase [Rhizoctonia solani]|uniref:Metal-independent alpha-mannosidase n=1 Tax=Rhizoctonia solani TaxID=456999 RepID=A0A8H7LKP3_9AGAM|nr:Metal-independent alpha-mannosidase [Rhizoctonia solani]
MGSWRCAVSHPALEPPTFLSNRPVGMPKLFIDQPGNDETQYAFMDAAGNKQFTSTSSVDLIDGTTSTDIYEHTGMISHGHLVATIKWPSNNFRDPSLILYPDVDSGDTGHTTRLPLSTNHIKQSLNLVTKGHSRAHWRRIPETDKLALFAGHHREKRLIADECHRAGKRWLQIEGKLVHHSELFGTFLFSAATTGRRPHFLIVCHTCLDHAKSTIYLLNIMGFPHARNGKLRIAAIGAGASGLASLRTLADEFKKEISSGDCEITCFERRNDTGGICRLPDRSDTKPQSDVPDTPLYNCLTTNLPLPIMLYPSCDPAPSTHLFPPAQAIVEYLHKYETRFKLRPFIRFSTVVSRALWNDNTHQWDVTTHPRNQPENSSELCFDHLLVTNGHYGKPHFVTFPGIDDWSASGARTVIHSMWYREPSQYHGLRVLVVGGGPSGNDLASDLSTVARKTIQSVRSFEDEDLGPVTKRGKIDHFTADGLVVFENGKQAHVDRVILATGYEYDFPFLPQLPIRNPGVDETSFYTSRAHIYPLARHIFPLLTSFPLGSIAFIGIPVRLAPFPLFEAQALLVARVISGRVSLDLGRELELCKTRNEKLIEVYKSPERVARNWHVLDGDAQFAHREELWHLAGESRTCPEWSSEIYQAKVVLRDEWRDLVRTGEADSWSKGVGEGGMKDWVELMHTGTSFSQPMWFSPLVFSSTCIGVVASLASEHLGLKVEHKNPTNSSHFQDEPSSSGNMQFVLALASAATLVLPVAAQCEDYSKYSTKPQGIPSAGVLGLPLMRPPPECRTFNSSSVETVIDQMKKRLKDPDVGRLFENTFPNTLDTTVKYFSKENNLAFIITGVSFPLTAQWLRDTANQLAHYHSLLGQDKELATLVKAVINNEARYIAEYPYCGAFQPPPESGLKPTVNDWALGVTVNPPVNNQTVFECKYELDSLCGFLKLSRSYYQATKDPSFANDNWDAAISQIFRVIEEQSQGTFDEDFNVISYYNWTGGNGALSPQVPNRGNGEPKGYTGMVGTHHRPSDDLSTYAFLTPANAMLSVELAHLADALDSIGRLKNVSDSAREWSSQIRDAIWNHTVSDGVFAYETNGLGSQYLMDDANVPSLLSLPYLGFLNKTDPTYVKTKDMILSRRNPYYAKGKTGPHVDTVHPWPMSLISAIYGSDDNNEIEALLYTIVNNTAGLGLIHESQNVHNGSDYTRPWFAWANSYFAEMLLDLAQRKPSLIFNSPEPYIVGKDA